MMAKHYKAFEERGCWGIEGPGIVWVMPGPEYGRRFCEWIAQNLDDAYEAGLEDGRKSEAKGQEKLF